MKFEASALPQYSIHTPTKLIINVHSFTTPHQSVLQDSFTIEPYMKVEELLSVQGENRFIRVDIPTESVVNISYAATVYNSFKLTFFFFQAEDGIRDIGVTGVQTCALPI